MMGTLFALLLSLVLIFFSYWKRDDVAAVVKFHLAVMPQLPIAMFLNHNLDHVRDEKFSWYLLLPVFTSLVILAVTALGLRMGSQNKLNLVRIPTPLSIALIGYALFTIGSSAFGSDVVWSFYAMAWTLPFCFVFLYFGHEKLFSEETNYFSLSVIFTCAFSLLIVFLAISTGRANSVFTTRSFGSILSTTGVLQMITMYVPIASLEKRRSRVLNALFWIFPIVLMGFSLSRSAVIPFLSYLAALVFSLRAFDIKNFNREQILKMISLALVPVVGVFALLSQSETWMSRFAYLPYAIQTRIEAFGEYWSAPLKGNPFLGVGYGLTKFHHPLGYSDLHNLFLTEVYENGLGAGILIFCILMLGCFYSFDSLKVRRLAPWGVGFLAIFILAHIQGCNLAIRNPGSYNTPYFLCFFFYMLGHLEREYFSKRALESQGLK